MSHCPAYLGVTINDRLDHEELFRYDILIVCPVDFNVTFKVPNWGQQPSKTFDLRLRDSLRSHDVYLTQLVLDSSPTGVGGGRRSSAAVAAALPVESASEGDAEALRLLTFGEDRSTPLNIFAFIGVVATVPLVVCLLVYICIETSSASSSTCKEPTNEVVDGLSCSAAATAVAAAAVTDGTSKPTGCPNAGGSACRRRRLRVCFVCCYVVARLAYSIASTFTALFLVVALLVRPELIVLRRAAAHLDADQRNATARLAVAAELGERVEIDRQRRAVDDWRTACTAYVDDLYAGAVRLMENATYGRRASNLYDGRRSAVGRLMTDRVGGYLAGYAAAVRRHTAAYRRRVAGGVFPSYVRYRRLLESVFAVGWLDFPQRLFNGSRPPDDRFAAIKASANLSGVEADFVGGYLHVAEVDDVQMWLAQFWERFVVVVSCLLPRFCFCVSVSL